MSSSVRFELLTLVLVTLISVATQSMIDSDSEYLITRSDVNEVLSKIIKPDDRIALLSDFDGTLGEINTFAPTLAFIKPESKHALEQLVGRPNVFLTIISGRQIIDVSKRTGIDNVTYSGTHGMEIRFSNQTEFHYPIAAETYANCTKLKARIEHEFADPFGGYVEDKNTSLVYHFRNVSENLLSQVIDKVCAVVFEYGYVPVKSHGAIEIKPPVVWTKGHAALLILDETYGINWANDVRVIYMGDDTSDEDAMELLKGKATTFRITEKPDIETYATYKMQSVDTATYLLEWLVKNIISN